MSDQITQLSMKDLLHGRDRYVIPMYQRNYAWEEGEITQLIQDVIDYLPEDRPYYIGTLVVFRRQRGGTAEFETIDGQQRLTTLSLLASFLRNKHVVDLGWYRDLKIHFESRKQSEATFDVIFAGDFEEDPSERLAERDVNEAIVNGYLLIQKILPLKLSESGVAWQAFADYLFERVQIMRVEVPPDTDLNHYFEAMNNRGEQLEKHEVLKARMLEALDGLADPAAREASRHCLHLIWEACANMERYAQMGFVPVDRDALFGERDWGQFLAADFDDLRDKLSPRRSKPRTAQTLDEIIANARGEAFRNEDDEPVERFNSVINFPNFLLHVLRVITEEDVPLDDKRLIPIFEKHVLKANDAVERVKHFSFSLFRCKYLLDRYIIKREFIKGTDGWSLKRLKWSDGGEKSRGSRASYVNTFGDEDGDEGDNRHILMLLSAFHVSTPTLVYKHWLNAALSYLFRSAAVRPDAYLDYLESVAKAFVFDRFLSEPGAEYFDIIYKNRGRCAAQPADFTDEAVKSRLSFGNVQNNLVFNYLDYLLWLEHQQDDATVSSYEFTFRSSVEHYYPRNPLQGYAPLPPEIRDSFGNLCLISHSKNSRLSNLMPTAKKEYYANNSIDSLKQFLMMKRSPWDQTAIAEHYEEMKRLLLKSI